MKDSSFFEKKEAKKLLLLGALLALGACADDAPPPPQSFLPLHYEYLPKLRLNVGSIDVQDHSQPVSPQDIAASSPAVPAQVLGRMARDRLFAAGLAGQADFVIDQASIVQTPDGALDGHLAVHLDLISPAGTRAGFARAEVSSRHTQGSEPEDGSFNLYQLTKEMMKAMNVELEFQLKRSLATYLVAPGSTPASVQAQPLQSPGQPPPPPLPPADPDATPPPDTFQDPAASPPQQMSPPPGYLQLPPGTPSP